MPAEIPVGGYSFMFLSSNTLISNLRTKINTGLCSFHDSTETVSCHLLGGKTFQTTETYQSQLIPLNHLFVCQGKGRNGPWDKGELLNFLPREFNVLRSLGENAFC